MRHTASKKENPSSTQRCCASGRFPLFSLSATISALFRFETNFEIGSKNFFLELLFLPFLLFISVCFLVSSCASGTVAGRPGSLLSAEKSLKIPGTGKKENENEKISGPGQRSISVEGSYAVIDFRNADISKVGSEFGAALDRRITAASGVKGEMTIQSLGRVPADALPGILLSVLEANGLKAEASGQSVKIVPLEGAEGRAFSLDSRLVTEVIPLHHVRWEDAIATLRELTPPDAKVEIYEPANLIIISALPQDLQKFVEISGAVDAGGDEKKVPRNWVYRVENGEAGNLETVLKKVFRPAYGEANTFELTHDADINALVVRSTPDTYLKLLKLLRGLDVPPRQVLIDVLVAEVRLTDSTQLGLEWLLKNSGTNFTAVGGFNQGSVGIGPDGAPFANLSQGFSAALTGEVDSIALAAVLNSLVRKDLVSILASPQILAMDGKQAKIEIGSDLPVASGFFQQPSTGGISNTLVSVGQIRYRSVGTVLSVLPHITDKNKVTLHIVQEVSQQGQPVPVAGQNFLGFDVRRAYTTASVENGETLIIGGLINETKKYTRAGVPLLSRIPILGYLFSVENQETDRTELVVMVTPHIVSGKEEADAVTKSFENRVGLVKNALIQSRDFRQN